VNGEIREFRHISPGSKLYRLSVPEYFQIAYAEKGVRRWLKRRKKVDYWCKIW
jgi:hypothetical protein